MFGRLLALLAGALLASAPPAAAQEPASAQEGGESRLGWYAGIAMGVGVNTFERNLQRRLGFNVSTNEVVGLDGRLGYRLHPNLAAELQVQWMNPFRADAGELCTSTVPPTNDEIRAAFPFPNTPSPSEIDQLPCRGRGAVFPAVDPIRSADPFRIEPVVATLNGRAYLATGTWQPYLLFGSGIIHVDIRDKARCASGTVGVNACGKDVQDFGFALRIGGGLEHYITETLVITIGASYVLPISGRAQDYDYISFEPMGFTYRFE